MHLLHRQLERAPNSKVKQVHLGPSWHLMYHDYIVLLGEELNIFVDAIMCPMASFVANENAQGE
jgi:hypothetical protein